MAEQIDDYNASVPSNFSQSLNIVIPPSPGNVLLAEFGLSVPSTGINVLIVATIGWQSTLGTPEVLFRVSRGTTVIGSTRDDNFSVVVNQFTTTTLHIVDTTAPIGYHAYRLRAEVLNPVTNQASVVGPITFSGISMSNNP